MARSTTGGSAKPAKPKKTGRFKQFWQVFTMTRKADPAVVWLLLLALLGGVLLLGLLAWAAVRWWAWEPRWLVRSRHASAEAGWRASAAWAEFTDWVRLGR